MIDFRYHVISIVAIFLALATGIALGAGPLGSKLSDGLVSQFNQTKDTVDSQRVQLAEAERIDDFNAAFAAEVDSTVLDGLLDGAAVMVVGLPGAENPVVEAVVDDLEAAGATVVSEVAVSPTLLDPANRTTAENLSTSLLEGIEGVPTVDDAGSYPLVGYALAQGLLSPTLVGAPTDPTSQEIQSAFEGADYLAYEGDVQRRAGLVVVVAGDPPTDADAAQPEVLASILESMDALSAGVVLAGPVSTTEDGGYLRFLRDSDVADAVSTVDVVDQQAGRIATVLALVEQAVGATGHYGVGDNADEVVPPLPEAGEPQAERPEE